MSEKGRIKKLWETMTERHVEEEEARVRAQRSQIDRDLKELPNYPLPPADDPGPSQQEPPLVPDRPTGRKKNKPQPPTLPQTHEHARTHHTEDDATLENLRTELEGVKSEVKRLQQERTNYDNEIVSLQRRLDEAELRHNELFRSTSQDEAALQAARTQKDEAYSLFEQERQRRQRTDTMLEDAQKKRRRLQARLDRIVERRPRRREPTPEPTPCICRCVVM